MPIQVLWGNEEKSLLYYRFLGTWKWGELYQAIQKANEMMNIAQHFVVLIMDYREGEGIPLGIPLHLGDKPRIPSSQFDSGIFICLGGFGEATARQVMELIEKISSGFPVKTEWQFVDTLEEAEELAHERAIEFKTKKNDD